VVGRGGQRRAPPARGGVRRARRASGTAIPLDPEPCGEALEIARLGLAIHAGFDATARKYLRRLLRTRGTNPLLWLRIASRVARSFGWRLLAPPRTPVP
jgi:hypothetical protein